MINAGEKRDLGDCPKCGSPLTNRYGVVRCTKWACDFIEGLREFVEGKHIARVAEESEVERNLVNITKEEQKREKQYRADGRTGLLARLGFRR
jgi:uncharacterized Zn finger protein (UPF0148 family)